MTLSDRLLAHLRDAARQPDLSETRYTLAEEIGHGGMGTVYRAHDRLLNRDVALKVMDADTAEEEARVLARLEHPSIVPVYDAGRLPDGRHYAAMRLVEGRRLDSFVAEEASLGARLAIFLKACDAVAFAHRSGIIHRDLKPQNIMVGSFGEVFVMDWGVAVRSDAQDLRPAGTPRYMAPETAVTPARDIYSLGRLLEDVLAADAVAPLAAIAARALAPKPDQRYRTVEELEADVVRYLDRLPVSAYRESMAERALRFTARNRTLLLLIGAYFAVRLGLFFLRP